MAWAWLSVDEADNDPARFWSHLIATLRLIDPSLGGAPPPKHDHAHSSEAHVTFVLNTLAGWPHQFALVLDDCHLMTSPAMWKDIILLTRHLPPEAHLFLAIRGEAELPFPSHLRSGAVRITGRDLLFSHEEAHEYLTEVMNLDIPDADRFALCNLTEGWIAGLQMAALSMRESGNTGQLRTTIPRGLDPLWDYLAEEVFSRLPIERREFLLTTSILQDLEGPLCDAVTGHTRGDETLRSLLSANLFITEVDEARGIYRYHPLFADFLRGLVKRESPDAAPVLHARASAWFERNDSPLLAISHCLASGDTERAALLIDHNLELIARHRNGQELLRWASAFPPGDLESNPSLLLVRATGMMRIGEMRDLERDLAAAERLVAAGTEAPPSTAGVIAVLRATSATHAGADPSRILELNETAAALLPGAGPQLRTELISNLAWARWRQGDLAGAADAFAESARIRSSEGDVSGEAHCTYRQGDVLKELGFLKEAHHLYLRATELVEQADPQVSYASGIAQSRLANLHYEWNELELAEQWATAGISIGASSRGAGRLVGHLSLAQLRLGQGRLEDAIAQFDQARRHAERLNVSSFYREMEVIHARIWFEQGDVDAVTRWARRALGPSFKVSSTLAHLPELQLTAQALVTNGYWEPALDAADRMLELVGSTGLRGAAIAALALRGTCLNHLGANDQGRSAIGECVSLAAPQGYLRTIVDLGELVVREVVTWLSQPRSATFPAMSVLATPDYWRRLRQGMGGRANVSGQDITEPLTRRELEVMRLVAQGLSNREIGQALVVEEGTVKKYTHYAFQKMGVARRTQAVARAQEAGLL